jgi:hypothetical protein
MPYLGRSPSIGVRSRYIYTASGGQTLFSGTDSNGKTLAYADGAYVDVYLNGVNLVPTTDFTATTKTSITLTSGATASDIVEIVAYDISSIADTVSKLNGGEFGGNITAPKFLTTTTKIETAIFRINDQTLSTDTTIAADENANCTGPLTVGSGVTLTVASGGNLVII